MQRFGAVIGLKSEKVGEYKWLHAVVWPEVAAMITQCGMRNYSIYLHKLPDGNHYLFSYFEYVGENFKADMDRMAADPLTQQWWSFCSPQQQPLADRAPGEWWSSMEEVFHQE